MSLDPLFRRMTIIITGFAFMGFILGSVALMTPYWTEEIVPSSPGMPIPSANGTVITNDLEWMWNVSFIFI